MAVAGSGSAAGGFGVGRLRDGGIWLDVLLMGGHCRRGHSGIRPLLMCLLHEIHDWPAGGLPRRVRG